MNRFVSASLVILACFFGQAAIAQDKAPEGDSEAAIAKAGSAETCDSRPVINKKSLKIRGYDVVEQVELTGFGPGWSAVLLKLALPEAENQALAAVNRLYILDGDRIEFDSFSFDAIEDGIEPSVSTRTFFQMKWEVTMKGKAPSGLLLTGIVPRQLPGDKIRVATRTLVLTWSKGNGFHESADVVSREPARLNGGTLTVPVN
jgi:hypothetical protein